MVIGGGSGERLGSHCLPYGVPSIISLTVILYHDLEKLGKSCKYLLTEDEEEDVDIDIKAFVNGRNLPSYKDSNRIHKW